MKKRLSDTRDKVDLMLDALDSKRQRIEGSLLRREVNQVRFDTDTDELSGVEPIDSVSWRYCGFRRACG